MVGKQSEASRKRGRAVDAVEETRELPLPGPFVFFSRSLLGRLMSCAADDLHSVIAQVNVEATSVVEQQAQQELEVEQEENANEDDDDDDSDVGPMPMPLEGSGAAIKKRRGTFSPSCSTATDLPSASLMLPFLSMMISPAAREAVPGPSSVGRSILEILHAPGHSHAYCRHAVCSLARSLSVLWVLPANFRLLLFLRCGWLGQTSWPPLLPMVISSFGRSRKWE